MLYWPEKVPLLSRVKDKAFAGIYFSLALLVMAGWVYLLGSMLWKFALWCIS